jgi:sugar/nucleoside kinase (ribokinase family)
MDKSAETRIRLQLAEQLRAATGTLPSVAIGFDGFVDEMIRVVGERLDPAQYTAVPDITTFAQHIAKAAARSSLREIVVTDTVPGGCTINMGDGLAALGLPVDAFATIGEPAHPAFAAITRRFRRVESWGSQPGRTLAFEFTDGKVMFSAVSQLAELTPLKAQELLARGRFAAACREAGMIALTDWTLFPHLTAVWRLLLAEVFSKLPHRPRFFIDLVDPTGRSDADIREMLALLRTFEPHGAVTLGLNGNEANAAGRALGLPACVDERPDAVRDQAAALRAALGISEVVIHHVKVAAAAAVDGAAAIVGPYCAAPRKTTGAGDRFNAGYALGLLLKLDITSRLLLGAAGSGFFVRHARSAARAELAAFLGDADWTEPAR